jgi:4-amino-4-deoxy-L-arabinose transferase-like glycosyltransferase
MRFRGLLTPTILIIILLSVIGSAAIFYSTRWGPWAFSDSAGYLVSARNLLAGHGLGYPGASGDFMPLSLHPPFYSLVLSAIGLLGVELITAARWLNIILFGTTIFLTGALSYKLFYSSWLSLSLCISLLVMPVFVDVSSGAMSELLFFFTALLGIFLLILYLKGHRRYLLIFSSLFIGLSFLTRINGAVVVGMGVLVLALARNVSWKQKIRDVFVFCLVSLSPVALWLIWVYFKTGTLAARQYSFNPHLWSITTEFRLKLMQSFWSWLPFQQFLPAYSYRLSRNVFLTLMGLILVFVCLIVLKKIKDRQTLAATSGIFTFALLWITFIIGNILLIAASDTFSSTMLSKDSRTFFYIQFGLVFAFLALFLSIIKEYRLPTWVGWICATVILVINLSYARSSWNIIQQYHLTGSGYTSQAWHKSATLAMARALPANISLISNETAATLLLMDRPAYDFCVLPCSLSGSVRYGDNRQDPVQNIFREDGAALVLFYPMCGDQPWFADTLAQLNSITQNLRQYFFSCDGAIYFYPSSAQD